MYSHGIVKRHALIGVRCGTFAREGPDVCGGNLSRPWVEAPLRRAEGAEQFGRRRRELLVAR